MEITITSLWWVIPAILTIATWVYFYIKLEVAEDRGQFAGIATLVWLLLSGFLTSIYWLIYFIIF